MLFGNLHRAKVRACCGFIDKVYRLVGKISVIDVSCRKSYRGINGFGCDLDIVVVFVFVLYALEDTDALFLSGLFNGNGLETPL